MEERREWIKEEGGSLEAYIQAEQLGEEETWKDQVKKLVRQNKLAVFSAVVIVLILLAAVFGGALRPLSAGSSGPASVSGSGALAGH